MTIDESRLLQRRARLGKVRPLHDNVDIPRVARRGLVHTRHPCSHCVTACDGIADSSLSQRPRCAKQTEADVLYRVAHSRPGHVAMRCAGHRRLLSTIIARVRLVLASASPRLPDLPLGEL